jgi:hypothetical protein
VALKKRFISVNPRKKQGVYYESQRSAASESRARASSEGSHSSATVKLADE